MSIRTRTRRHLAGVAAAAMTAGTLLAVGAAPASAEPVVTTGDTPVTDATFTWGLSGYAQVGIFGPWGFKDFTGDAAFLEGDVATTPNPTPQTEYAVDPVPATSFPTSKAGKAPNAVQFTDGTGVRDAATDVLTLAWDGSYTVNAYPVAFGAPNEIYEDPELTVNPDGSGDLTVEFTLGAGVDVNGDPVEAEEFGRLQLATFDAGSLSVETDGGFRVTPDYQGVTNDVANQTTTCTTEGGATGWWGSWPTEFIDAIADTAVVAHFYSTGCGGLQDNKPPLPFDVTFDEGDAPTVTVSETEVSSDGTTVVTVEGENFDPALATGARPPFLGQPGGAYVAFAKVADVWRPSQGAGGATRGVANGNPDLTKWAVPSAQLPVTGASGVELTPDGSFTAEITVDRATLDATATAATLTQYGIITYPGSGASAPSYETLTPLTFVDEVPSFTDVPENLTFHDEIIWLATSGITTGYEDGTFRPAEPVLREQMAAFLYRFADEPTVERPAESPFTDVSEDDTFYDEIIWLESTGITTGYDEADGTRTFRPSQPVLREQMAAFLYRFDEQDFVDDDGATFTDVAPAFEFFDEIEWLATTGITTGYQEAGDTVTFRGAQPVLREQMAAFLFRYDEYLQEQVPAVS
ncbi:hypothetical protein HMPREF0063_11451 [Aeromicrobium marinum DSM 15272]|uniref:SLH domain-containing protein n=1 Tax=Aeromicrobium marinum DSM 15272 TaxID=585531 RepID=E2SBP2_9ACTN|nr:S-layer homology domain-containing protein [Aeromicrobium marinum]EFQ83788.1 hypothetical protein HMPREF0063_11451 [Aeromicrobium marinum DSM 15272]